MDETRAAVRVMEYPVAVSSIGITGE